MSNVWNSPAISPGASTLHNIYTDLPNSLKYMHAILFIFTAIYTKAHNLKSLYENVNSDLDALDEWFKLIHIP